MKIIGRIGHCIVMVPLVALSIILYLFYGVVLGVKKVIGYKPSEPTRGKEYDPMRVK